MLRSNLMKPYNSLVMAFLLAILYTLVSRYQKFAGKCRLQF